MALTGKDNAEKIWNYLKGKGLSDVAIAGMMGNIKQESGCNPKNLQSNGNTKLRMTDDEYTKAVDNGTYKNFVRDSFGYGLVQHTYYTRKQKLIDYAKQVKKSIGDLEMQLDFIYNKELCTNYKKSTLDKLKTAKTVREASDIFLLNYEKPADQSTKAQEKRASYGMEYYNLYSEEAKEKASLNMTLRNKVVEYASKYIETKEMSDLHKFIIDTYNSITPLPLSYKVKYTDAWCATFVSFISIALGLTDIMPRECSCGRKIELYKKLNRWQEADNYVPNPGDEIFYDWEDKADYASTDNKGWADHVGIVQSVKGNVITVIEGNIDNKVGTRELQVNGRYIRGYGLPDYGSSKATGKEVIKNPHFEIKSYLAQTTSDLNLRSSAESVNKHNIIKVIPKSHHVYVMKSVNEKWVQINTVIDGDSYVGYVSKAYLKTVDISKNEIRQVTADGLNVRTEKNAASPKICTMNKGDRFTVITSGTWGFILFKDKLGFANISNAYSKKI